MHPTKKLTLVEELAAKSSGDWETCLRTLAHATHLLTNTRSQTRKSPVKCFVCLLTHFAI